MTQTSTYLYYEGCGFESEPFEAHDDDAAEVHVLSTFRSPSNADFDGDEGGIVRIVDGERELVIDFPGENMIPDPAGQRQSYRGGC
jgi:hypothetical protein